MFARGLGIDLRRLFGRTRQVAIGEFMEERAAHRARLIVDSSKRLRRLTALLRHATLPVVPIHLLRNPNGQIYSMIKRGKTAVVEPASHYRRTTLSTLRLLRGRDHVSLRYEALVTEPEAALQRVMPLLGLDYEPSQLDWAAAERDRTSTRLNP